MTTPTIHQQRGANVLKEWSYQWKQCSWCHQGFKSLNGNEDYCSKTCEKDLRKFERAQMLRATDQDRHFNRCEFEVITDVLKEENGGFKPGARFSKMDLVSMLELQTISQGCRIRYLPNQREYVVDYRAVGKPGKKKSKMQKCEELCSSIR